MHADLCAVRDLKLALTSCLTVQQATYHYTNHTALINIRSGKANTVQAFVPFVGWGGSVVEFGAFRPEGRRFESHYISATYGRKASPSLAVARSASAC